MEEKVDFEFFYKLVKETSGINLNHDKNYLVETRLQPVIIKYKFANLAELVARLKYDWKGGLFTEVIDAIAIHESMFFRDVKPFEQLKNIIIPKLLKNKPSKSSINIWSAACSTGQEPISVAITLMEHPLLKNVEIKILATDIAENVLNKARSGIYSHFEIDRGLFPEYLKKYFVSTGKDFAVKKEILDKISYRKLNLVDDFSHLPKFDIILCRNILIYFDLAQKASIIKKITARMEPYSYLIVGGTESLMGIEKKLTFLKDTTGILSFTGE